MVATATAVKGAGARHRAAHDWLVASAVLGLLALALSIYVAAEEAPVWGDVTIARHIQDAGALRDNADWINAAGDWRWLPFAAAAIATGFAWRLGAGRGPAAGRRAALWAFACGLVLWEGDRLLKLAIRSPRPSASFGLDVDRLRSDFGFPSGHVYGDVLIYGLLAAFAPAYLHPRLVPVARVLLVALIVLAGPARVVVGAHWPSDVAGGYLWGGAALCLALAAARRFA